MAQIRNLRFSHSWCLLPWGESPVLWSFQLLPSHHALLPWGTKGTCTQTVLSSFSEKQAASRNKVLHPSLQGREGFLILSCHIKNHTCPRYKTHSPASALTIINVIFLFLYCSFLALFPSWFKTWAGGKVLLLEPPQTPNSCQSLQIVPLLPSNVSLSPTELNLEIVWVFSPLHLIHEYLVQAPHRTPELLQQHPSSLLASVLSLLLPKLTLHNTQWSSRSRAVTMAAHCLRWSPSSQRGLQALLAMAAKPSSFTPH